MHIFITGYMGVGKSTIGRELSTLLNLPFVDLDEYIVRQKGAPIKALFEKGEDTFRHTEREHLLQLCKKKEQHIISLGGGTMCYLDNHLDILKNGIAIYLYKEWEDILTYLPNLQERPLVENNTTKQLEAIFRKREPFYELSQLKMPINTTFEVKKLANYLKILTNR